MDIALTSTSRTDGTEVARGFTVIPIDAAVAQTLGQPAVQSVGGTFARSGSGRAAQRIGAGDRLAIVVWEPSADGLFTTAERRQTSIDATVDEGGSVFIPYVGQIAVTGLRADEVRTRIEAGLKGRAVDPQVQVSIAESSGQRLSMLGDVGQPGRVDVPPGGLRLLDALALAGGSRQPAFESEVTILRGTASATLRLDEVARVPQNNVWLTPGDTIQVLHRPRSFTAFGAVTSQKLQQFQTERVSIAEALAQSGGLNDNLADAGGVFLFRFEPEARLRHAWPAPFASPTAQGIPTIYRLDFSTPQAFFLAGSFQMQDKDILYVANAPGAEFRKFVATILSPALVTARAGDALNR